MESDASFGWWLRRRRKALDLTQEALAARVGCAVTTIRKIEADTRRPSRQIAEILAEVLAIAPGERAAFLKAARAELAVDRLSEPAPAIGPAATPASPRPLPSGTVTFLFTDIEGCSRLWEQHAAMPYALLRHNAILGTAIERHGGVVFRTVGDTFCAAFARAPDALAAAIDAQRALRDDPWPAAGPLRVRIALHTGVVEVRAGDYLGQPLNRVARLLASGHGGQIVLSRATEELVAEHLPPQVALRDLGTHQLRDLSRPEQIFQVVAADLPADFPLLALPDDRPVHLPIPLTPLIGRETELAELVHLLARAECRLLTLVGPGGIGKTRLAIAAAAEQGEAFADGVSFVALAPLNAPEFIVPTIAEALGFTFYGPTEPKAQLLSYLREKHALLLLDNVEQLLDGAGLLSELLQHAPAVKLLVTSRERLQLQGEWVFDLQGLPVPPIGQTVQLEAYSAVGLFVERAQRARTHFTLMDRNRADVAQICQLVEGLPLGIELAAAWVSTLSCAEIAQEIERNLDFLAVSVRDLPERHRSIRAVFDHSWKLLTLEEQQVLQRLSVFRGGFTREAAEQVAGATLGMLSSLLAKSLLHRTAAGRYDLHELVRQYVGRQLAEVPTDHAATYTRFGQYYADWLQRQEAPLFSAEQRATVDMVTTEVDNVRAALHWAVTHQDWASLDKSLDTLFWFYEIQDRFEEGATTLDQWIAALRQVEAQSAALADYQIALGHALAVLGWFLACFRQLGRAREVLEQSLGLLRSQTAPNGLAIALQLAAALHLQAGDYAQCEQYWLESLNLQRTLGRDVWVARCYYFLSYASLAQGRLADARMHVSEALRLLKVIGETFHTIRCQALLTTIVSAQGDLPEAARLARETLALSRTINDPWPEAQALIELGVLALRQGQYAESQRQLRESIALLRQLGEPWSIARALNHLGDATYALGDDSEAQRCFLEGLRTALAAQAPTVALDTLVGIAAVRVRAGATEPALELLMQILSHPSSSPEAKDRAERLRTEVAAQLTPQQIEVAQARVQAKTFEAVVAEILSVQ